MSRIALFFFLWLFLFSCQSLKSTTSPGSRFQEKIDDASPKDIISHTQKILVSKYQYELARTNQSPSSIYIETMWKMLPPTPDEENQGIEDIRTRFKIESRQMRSGGIGDSQLHNLTFKAEVETSKDSEPGWSKEITLERKAYLDQIFYDFETEFRTGIRNY